MTAYQLHTPVRFIFEWNICKDEVLIGIFSHSQSDGYNLKLHYQWTEHLDIVYNSRYFKFVVIALLKQPISCLYMLSVIILSLKELFYYQI